MENKEKRTYTFIGRKQDLDILEKAFRHIEYLGQAGATRNILIRVDGDGAGRVNVEDINGNRLDNEKYNISQNNEKTFKSDIVGIYDIG